MAGVAGPPGPISIPAGEDPRPPRRRAPYSSVGSSEPHAELFPARLDQHAFGSTAVVPVQLGQNPHPRRKDGTVARSVDRVCAVRISPTETVAIGLSGLASEASRGRADRGSKTTSALASAVGEEGEDGEGRWSRQRRITARAACGFLCDRVCPRLRQAAGMATGESCRVVLWSCQRCQPAIGAGAMAPFLQLLVELEQLRSWRTRPSHAPGRVASRRSGRGNDRMALHVALNGSMVCTEPRQRAEGCSMGVATTAAVASVAARCDAFEVAAPGADAGGPCTGNDDDGFCRNRRPRSCRHGSAWRVVLGPCGPESEPQPQLGSMPAVVRGGVARAICTLYSCSSCWSFARRLSS
jgi:hypothetical protein